MTDPTAEPDSPRVAQLPTGGDQHRFTDLVERDAVPSRERLHRGDARNDVVLDVDFGRDGVEDAQRAVVQRRVTPGQEGTYAVGTQFGRRWPVPRPALAPRASPKPPPGSRPDRPTGPTARGRATRRIDSRDSRMNRAQISRRSATRSLFASPLSIAKKPVGAVQRLDRLDGQVVGVPGADADDVDVPTHRAQAYVPENGLQVTIIETSNI